MGDYNSASEWLLIDANCITKRRYRSSLVCWLVGWLCGWLVNRSLGHSQQHSNLIILINGYGTYILYTASIQPHCSDSLENKQNTVRAAVIVKVNDLCIPKIKQQSFCSCFSLQKTPFYILYTFALLICTFYTLTRSHSTANKFIYADSLFVFDCK